MSSERTEERLDAMLAALRDRPARLDEITRARVGARLEAALAGIDPAEAPRPARGWRRRAIAAGLGLAAAAAVLAVVAAARDGEPAGGETAAAGAPAPSGGGGASATASAGGAAGAAPAPSASGVVAATAAAGAAAGPPAAAATAPSAVTAPIAVAAGDSAQLTLDGAAVTVYGPGRLSPMRDGVVAEAAGLVVDRTHGDTPWTVRYHGIEIVATRATFAIDRGAEPRVTVMRGDLVLRCPSGARTIRSGASATCEPAASPRREAPPPPPSSAPPTLAPEPPPAPGPAPGPEPRPATATATDPYSVAESALRRGDPDAARAALTAVVDAAPDSLDAATALLDLARLAASRGEAPAALDYLDRLDRHPRRAALAAPAARLRGTLARPAPLGRPAP
jgi:hypothetical protein